MPADISTLEINTIHMNTLDMSPNRVYPRSGNRVHPYPQLPSLNGYSYTLHHMCTRVVYTP
jgi:hypothetical protein